MDARGAGILHGEVIGPMDPAHEEALRHADAIARIFDYQFRIAGVPIGLDAIIGLIPGVGDVVTGAVGLVFLKLGRDMGLPKHRMAAMVGNLAVDTGIGMIPLAGDLFDIGFRAHKRNAAILRRHAERAANAPRRK